MSDRERPRDRFGGNRARGVEALTRRHLEPAGRRDIACDGVLEREPALLDQDEGCHRGHRLRHRSHAKPGTELHRTLRLDVCPAGRLRVNDSPVPGEHRDITGVGADPGVEIQEAIQQPDGPARDTARLGDTARDGQVDGRRRPAAHQGAADRDEDEAPHALTRCCHSLFMKASPSRASCSSLSNIGRQILVAAARLGRSAPKASIVSQPS